MSYHGFVGCYHMLAGTKCCAREIKCNPLATTNHFDYDINIITFGQFRSFIIPVNSIKVNTAIRRPFARAYRNNLNQCTGSNP